ncbi:uncharacterized protein LOC142616862 [Castanea sativa]|uniref:uncharacterized protein LOC142616862 n=1 Tax=Castanea sativa TaxID=21020 RepID=UPI003F64D3C8
MEAKESITGSYAWKSILKGREVIQLGARFRVGNGKSIKIWQHHWLPIKHPPLISSPIIESMEDATVDCFIDHTTGKWDAEILKGVLIPAEAELAQRIPLPHRQTEDVLYWPFTANGQYTCKSGYKFLKDLEENLGDGNHSKEDKTLWKGIWSMEIPNKYKNLLWRACRNSLPTKQNLVRRTITQNPSCDRCSLQAEDTAEDTLHALWSCTSLNEVWVGDRWNFRSRLRFADFKELCKWVLGNGKPLELFAIQVWSIWNQRNKLRLNQPCCPTKELQKMAEDSWTEIRRHNLKLNRFSSSPTHQRLWTAPTLDSYKINYDGALSTTDNKSGIGIVVRDYHGEVIASLIQQLDQAYQPVEVEAMAASKAVEFGSELGIQRAIIEGDSAVVVKSLTSKECGLTPYSQLLNDVSLFSGFYSQLSYSHVKRDGNKVAHSLAKLALTTQSFTVWMEDVPSCTLPFVQADLAAL